MKRHLLGFALFNLIVGAALVVAIFTKSLPISRTEYVYGVSKTSCRMKVRQNYETRKDYDNNNDSIRVTQAVLNEKTGKLNMSFDIQRETPSTQDLTVKLTFINAALNTNETWDGKLRTEFITLSPNFSVNNQAVYSIPMNYAWLNDFGKKDNLYVKAEIYRGSSTDFEADRQSNISTKLTPVFVISKE